MTDYRKHLLDLAANWEEQSDKQTVGVTSADQLLFEQGRADQMEQSAEELRALADLLFPESEPEGHSDSGTVPSGSYCWLHEGLVHHVSPCDFPPGTVTDFSTGKVVQAAPMDAILAAARKDR